MNKEELKLKFVKENKQNPTIYETLMCLKLKAKKIKYIFQYPLNYENSFIICDIYIPKYNLIIEIDGGYHDEMLQTYKDIMRDKHLKSKGYNVLRLLNNEVDTFNTDLVKTYKQKENKQTIKEPKQRKYTLAQKAEDKKRLSAKDYRKKYPKAKKQPKIVAN